METHHKGRVGEVQRQDQAAPVLVKGAVWAEGGHAQHRLGPGPLARAATWPVQHDRLLHARGRRGAGVVAGGQPRLRRVVHRVEVRVLDQGVKVHLVEAVGAGDEPAQGGVVCCGRKVGGGSVETMEWGCKAASICKLACHP